MLNVLTFYLKTCYLLRVSADGGNSYVQNIRLSVREAALSVKSSNLEPSEDTEVDVSEHFFVPLSVGRIPHMKEETKLVPKKSK